jgi:hypothetical protein
LDDEIDEGFWLRLFVQVWCMVYALVYGIVEVQVDVWYMLAPVIGTGCYRLFGAG